MNTLYPIIRRKRRPLIDVGASALPPVGQAQSDTSAALASQAPAVSEPATPGTAELSKLVGSDAAVTEQGGDIGSPVSPSPVPDVSAPKTKLRVDS